MENEMTADQYYVQQLKRNTAQRYAEYEDAIAQLQTRVAMLEQQLESENDKQPDDAQDERE